MAERIVSLLPSATEIVCMLGAGPRLVGISHECDFPTEVRGVEVLTRARILADGSSRAIDTAVRAAIEDALSIYAIDAERLAALGPDVIVTQDLCEVCAVSLDDVRSAVARAAHRDVRIVSLRPTRFGDVLDDVQRVADAIGCRDVGVEVRASLMARIESTTQRARDVTRPGVVSIEWLDPLMLGGTWMPELIARAGGIALGAQDGAPAPTLTIDALAALRPDVVVIKPCGFTIARTMSERPLVDAIADAVPRARVYVTDGNAFFNRPGPRLVGSLEIMAACVHPDRFDDLARRHADAIVAL